MKISEAIARFDTLYPNIFPFEEKLKWLAELDGRIFTEILSLYENCEESFSPYTLETDTDTELLVPFPSDDIYIKFMCLKTDLINSDIARFNNSALLFNSAYSAFAGEYNRTHTFKENNRISFGGGTNAVSFPL